VTNSNVYKHARAYNIPYTTVTIDLVQKILHEAKTRPMVDCRGYDKSRIKKELVKRLELRLRNLRRVV
jgi:hypothetical protein